MSTTTKDRELKKERIELRVASSVKDRRCPPCARQPCIDNSTGGAADNIRRRRGESS